MSNAKRKIYRLVAATALCLIQFCGVLYGGESTEKITNYIFLNKCLPDSDAVTKAIKEARELAAKRSFYDAEKLLQNVISSYKENKPAVKELALIFSWDMKYDESINLYRTLLEKHPQEADIFLEIGRVYLWKADVTKNKDHITSAISAFSRFNRLYPNDLYTLKQMGASYLKLNNADSAYAFLLTATEISPSDNEAGRLLLEAVAMKNNAGSRSNKKLKEEVLNRISEAHELAAQRRFGEAEEILTGILAEDKNNSYASSELAKVYSWNKKYNESIKLYRSLLDLEPGNVGLHIEIAEVLLSQADETRQNSYRQEAIKEYESFLKFCPSDCFAIKQMGATYIKLGKIDSAFVQLKRAHIMNPSDEEAARLYAGVLSARAEYSQAAAILKQYVNLNPSNPDLRLLLADNLVKSGDLNSAENEYKTVLNNYPGDIYTVSRLGMVLLWNNKLDEARKFLQIAAIKKRDPESYIALGDIEFISKRWRAANEYYKVAYALDPENDLAGQRIFFADGLMKPRIDLKYGSFNSSSSLSHTTFSAEAETDFTGFGTWNIGFQKWTFSQENNSNITRNDISIMGSYGLTDWLRTEAAVKVYSFNDATTGNKNSMGFLFGTVIGHDGNVKLSLAYLHQPLTESYATVIPDYFFDKLQLSFEAPFSDNLTFYAYGSISKNKGTYLYGYWNPEKQKWISLGYENDTSQHLSFNGQILYKLSAEPYFFLKGGVTFNKSDITAKPLPYWAPGQYLQQNFGAVISQNFFNVLSLQGEISGFHLNEGSNWGYKASLIFGLRIVSFLDINSEMSICSIGTKIPWDGKYFGASIRLRYPQ